MFVMIKNNCVHIEIGARKREKCVLPFKQPKFIMKCGDVKVVVSPAK